MKFELKQSAAVTSLALASFFAATNKSEPEDAVISDSNSVQVDSDQFEKLRNQLGEFQSLNQETLDFGRKKLSKIQFDRDQSVLLAKDTELSLSVVENNFANLAAINSELKHSLNIASKNDMELNFINQRISQILSNLNEVIEIRKYNEQELKRVSHLALEFITDSVEYMYKVNFIELQRSKDNLPALIKLQARADQRLESAQGWLKQVADCDTLGAEAIQKYARRLINAYDSLTEQNTFILTQKLSLSFGQISKPLVVRNVSEAEIDILMKHSLIKAAVESGFATTLLKRSGISPERLEEQNKILKRLAEMDPAELSAELKSNGVQVASLGETFGNMVVGAVIGLAISEAFDNWTRSDAEKIKDCQEEKDANIIYQKDFFKEVKKREDAGDYNAAKSVYDKKSQENLRTCTEQVKGKVDRERKEKAGKQAGGPSPSRQGRSFNNPDFNQPLDTSAQKSETN